MKIYKIEYKSIPKLQRINLAIGNFDGVHLGHQAVIKKLVQESKKNKTKTAIMSFSPHPRKFFNKDKKNISIMSDKLKIDLISKFKVDYFILLKFNKTTSNLDPIDFIEKILVKKLHIKKIFVGKDFRFGKNRAGNVKLLKDKGHKFKFKVNILKPIVSKKTSKIYSSSIIRELISKGRFNEVNYYLGRNWSIRGKVIEGQKKARKFNFPTANIILNNFIYPKRGVYAVKVKLKREYYNGIANFGLRPTINGNKHLLEVHLFNFNLDIYGKSLTVEFVTFIRSERKFESFKKLSEQIHKDIKKVKKLSFK